MPVKSTAIFVAAWLSLFGVALGMLGTYLMTTAYHPFAFSKLFPTILTVLKRFICMQPKSAWALVQATAKAGDKLHKEQKALSLLGISLLFASFFTQAIGLALTLWDAYH